MKVTASEQIVHTIPLGTDLGPIESVEIGSKVALLAPNKQGDGIEIATTVYSVTEITERLVRVRATGGDRGCGHWLRKNGGGFPYAMHSERIMRGYFSANPEHIAAARRRAKEEAEEAKRQREERARLLEFAKPLGEALGDVWAEWDDNQGYCDGVAQILIDKLTPEQMKMLAGWMGVKLPE